MSLMRDVEDEDLRFKIFDDEGFDYFFMYWSSPDDILDPKLRQLAKNYRAAHEALEKYLDKVLPEEVD